MKKSAFIFICVILFVCNALATGSSPYPIIFVHGLNSDNKTWDSVIYYYLIPMWGIYDPSNVFHVVLNAYGNMTNLGGIDNKIETQIDNDVIIYFNQLKNDLPNASIYSINFKNWWDPITRNIKIYDSGKPEGNESASNESAIYKQGYALKKMIEAVILATGTEKVILVGHSMGGLAIREYLQRTDNGLSGGNHTWWQNPNLLDGHCVAKVVTIGTPHRGSNAWASLYPFIDKDSEAVRDLKRYSPIEEGIYLFSGMEIEVDDNFHNKDVNCNGRIDNFISGLNEGNDGTSFNIQMPLPSNIEYTWITSHIIGSFDDGAVDLQRQWLYDEKNTPVPLGCADTLQMHRLHIFETGDEFSVIRGLDEPDSPEFAYKLPFGKVISGFVTYQTYMIAFDLDFYKLTVPNSCELFFNIERNLSGMTSVAILNQDQTTLEDFKIEKTPFYFNLPVLAGTYFLKIRGVPTPENWLHAYSIQMAALSENTSNYALKFDGKDDYVEIYDPSNLNEYTIEAYIKVDDLRNSNIIVRTSSSGPTSRWSNQLRINDKKFEHYLWNSGARIVRGNTTIEIGRWYHVVITAKKNEKMKLYVNGIEDGNPVDINDFEGGLDRYLLGTVTGGGMNYFSGIIDELRISNTVRYEKQYVLNFPLPNDEYTQGLYHFEEGSGQIAYNAATGLNNLILGSTSDADQNDPLWIDLKSILVPKLIKPENHAFVLDTLQFGWKIETQAISYHLQVATDSLFANLLWDKSGIPATSKNIDYQGLELSSNQKYFWRLKFQYGYDGFSNWSEIRDFKILTSFDEQLLIASNFEGLDPDFTLNGNAISDNQNILLTQKQQAQAGSIFYNKPFMLTNFDAKFSVYLGDDQNGADGICFVWQSNSPYELGIKGIDHGGALGYENIKNSYAIEFDTWYNSEHGDPSNNHVGVNIDGSLQSLKTNNNIPTLEDGNWHDVRVRFQSHCVYVWLDEQFILNYPLQNYRADSSYYIGFSGATGRSTNEHRIDNFILKGSLKNGSSVETLSNKEITNVTDLKIVGYPNPFNDLVVFEFYLPFPGNVNIQIFDVLGRQVTTLLDESRSPGNYKLFWDAKNSDEESISTGIFFVILRFKNTIASYKILYVK